MSDQAVSGAGPDALLAPAAAAYAAGRDAQAEAQARAVLARHPGHLPARLLLAACRVAAGALDEGAEVLEAVLAEAPGDDEVRLQLATLRAHQGRHRDVVALLADAVRERPDFLAAYRPLAAALWELQARPGAVEVYRQLVALVPQDGAALRALGEGLRQVGAFAEALPVMRRAVALLQEGGPAAAADLLGARVALAEVLAELAMAAAADHAEAGAAARAAREMGVGNPDVLVRIAVVLHRAGDYAGAEESYAAALDIDPAHRDALLHRAMLRLVQGDLAGGWPGYEMRRHKMTQLGAFRDPPALPWAVPDDLHGRTVRVVLEQGMGDALHFARYLPLLGKRGARVELVMDAASPLRPLLEGMAAVARIIDAVDAPGPADAVVPLLSLPLAFGTELATIPAQVPYLAAPDRRRAVWRERLGMGGSGLGDGRPRVGVAWWGNAAFPNDRQRSIPLARFARLLARRDIAFHVLVDRLRDGEAGQAAELAAVHDGIGDFADTAALAEMMDLVVSVDTSVAHLAGALGRPVWILLPHDPDWRWLLGREDSPWYPTARLFRQPARGDWDGVLARVGEALDARFG